jgi:putative nucleotidyltransferase with HDIG domain
VGLLVFAGTAVLCGVLFGLVRSASKTLVDQRRALQEAFDGSVRSLAVAIDAKDAYASGHSSRVSHYAQAIARALGLPEQDVQAVRLASYLHDLGKIEIPDRLLLKAGTLDEQEWAAVRRHALIAHHILEPLPIDERVKLAVRYNHERWDGSGYPDGLAGEAIPIHARVLLAADAYVAMTSDRPYRKAVGTAGAIEELQRSAGSQFDPGIVAAFLRVLEQESAKVWALGPVISGAQAQANDAREWTGGQPAS